MLADWRTAPVEDDVRTTLGFLETMTLHPEQLAVGDAERVRKAGVSDEALLDAIHVGALFNMIVRLADSLGFEVPPPDALRARAKSRLQSGYRLMEIAPSP